MNVISLALEQPRPGVGDGLDTVLGNAGGVLTLVLSNNSSSMHETNSPKRARIRRSRAVQERTPNPTYREPVLVPREGCVSALRSPIPISESRVEAKEIQSRNVSHRDANCELKRQTPTVMTTPTRAVRLDGAASARGAPRGSCGVRLGRWDSKERAAHGCILFVARITAKTTH